MRTYVRYGDAFDQALVASDSNGEPSPCVRFYSPILFEDVLPNERFAVRLHTSKQAISLSHATHQHAHEIPTRACHDDLPSRTRLPKPRHKLGARSTPSREHHQGLGQRKLHAWLID